MPRPNLDYLINAKDNTRRGLKKTESNFKKVAGRATAAFAAIGTGATFGGLLSNSAKAARELGYLKTVANTTGRELSRLSFATNTVGIGTEKLADIYKDTQDKIGDFIQTGGGPLVDFFEKIAPKIGVTADQFRDLSGPDALQLYVSSLEKANLSQSDMIFYLEAIANNSSRLLPLLQANGKEFERLAQRGDEFGGVVDKELVGKSNDLVNSWAEVKGAAAGVGNSLVNTFGPAISGAAKKLATLINNARKAAENLGLLNAVEDTRRLAQIERQLIPLQTERARLKAILTDDTRTRAETVRAAQYAETQAKILELEKERALIREQQKDKPTGNENGFNDVATNATDAPFLNKDLQEAKLAYEQEIIDRQLQMQVDKMATEKALHAKNQQDLFTVEKYWKQRAQQLEGLTNKQKVQHARQTFGALLQQASSGSKKLFELNKAYQTADALINAKSAIVGAYNYGSKIGGPVLGAAFGAVAAAATFAQIKSIQSQQFGGGGGVSAPGGSVPTTTPAIAEPPVDLQDLNEQTTNIIQIDFQRGITDANGVRDFMENEFAEALRDVGGLNVQVIAS